MTADSYSPRQLQIQKIFLDPAFDRSSIGEIKNRLDESDPIKYQFDPRLCKSRDECSMRMIVAICVKTRPHQNNIKKTIGRLKANC